jgi:hypothetical protein
MCETRHLAAAAAAAFLLISVAGPAQAFEMGLPIDCEVGRTCVIQNYFDAAQGPEVQDYRCGKASYENHTGVDFRVPTRRAMDEGVDVLAVADGTVLRVRDGVPDEDPRDGGRAVENRECGNGVLVEHGDGWETQYCHMKRGSINVRPGEAVAAGAPLGQVGLSGKTEFPHLHISVRHNGKAVDPFDPEPRAGESCEPGAGDLWADSLSESLSYRSAYVLNIGFATGRISMADVESGALPELAGQNPPALVFYGRAIHLQPGDVQRLALIGPGGEILADNETEPADRDKAQVFAFVGKRRPGRGWEKGTYTGRYHVLREGEEVASAEATVELR